MIFIIILYYFLCQYNNITFSSIFKWTILWKPKIFSTILYNFNSFSAIPNIAIYLPDKHCLFESFARAFSKARRLVMFSQKTHDKGTCARSNTSRSAVALRRGRNFFITYTTPCQQKTDSLYQKRIAFCTFYTFPIKSARFFEKCLTNQSNYYIIQFDTENWRRIGTGAPVLGASRFDALFLSVALVKR